MEYTEKQKIKILESYPEYKRLNRKEKQSVRIILKSLTGFQPILAIQIVTGTYNDYVIPDDNKIKS
jgi:predicted lipase